MEKDAGAQQPLDCPRQPPVSRDVAHPHLRSWRRLSDLQRSSSPGQVFSAAQSLALQFRWESTRASSRPAQTANATTESPSPSSTGSRRFAHRRGSASMKPPSSHRDDARTELDATSASGNTTSASTQNSPPSATSSHTSDRQQRHSPSFEAKGRRNAKRQYSDSQKYKSHGFTSVPEPRSLRSGKLQHLSRRHTGSAEGDVDGEVLTAWRAASANKPNPSKGAVTSASQVGNTQGSSQAATGETKLGSSATSTLNETATRTHAEVRTPAEPTNGTKGLDTASAPSAHYSTQTNTGARSDRALRKLLSDHGKYLKNYKTLNGSTAVAAAVERLCAEALAQSALLEELTEVFASSMPPAPLTDAASRVSAPADPSAAASGEPRRARIVLTYSGAFVSSEALRDTPASKLAELHVPESVVRWLDSPIELPSHTMEDVVVSAEFALKQLMTLTGSAQGDAAAEGSQRDVFNAIDATVREQWYEAWGRQCGQPRDAEPALPPAATSNHPAMAQWYVHHLALSAVLASRLDGQRGPSLQDRHEAHRGSRKGKSQPHLDEEDAWRLLPCTDAVPQAAATGITAGDGAKRAPTRPDQTVSHEARHLVDSLYAVLQTLLRFKVAQETAHFALDGCGVESRVDKYATHDALQQDVLSASSEEAASEADGSVVDASAARAPRQAFAQLRQALRQLQRAEAEQAASATAPSSSSDSTPVKTTGTQSMSAARCDVSGAAERFLSVIARVDTLQRAETMVSSSAVAKATDAPASAQTELAPLSPSSATPSYTIAALDLMIGVLLRCLLFYVPMLRTGLANSIIFNAAQCWVRTDQLVTSSLWTANFSVCQLLQMYADGLNQVCQSLNGRGAGKTPASLYRCSFNGIEVSGVCQSMVKKMRLLCMPGVFDIRTKEVREVFSLSQPADEAERQVVASRRTNVPTTALLSREPMWKRVAAVALGSTEKQQVGYALWSFVSCVQLEAERAFAAAVSLHGRTTAELSATQADSRADTAQSPSILQLVTPPEARRRVMPLCFKAVDADRFFASKFAAGRTQNSTTPSASLIASFPTGPQFECASLCVKHLQVPYTLTRLTLCALQAVLKDSWATLQPKKKAEMWGAIRCAAVAPATTALYGSSTVAEEGVGLQQICSAEDVARTASWQAAAPALQCFALDTTPPLWSQLWSQLLVELSDLPPQVRTMMTQGSDAGGVQAAEEQRGSNDGGSSEDVSTSALRACWTELKEVAVMCAWMVVAAQHTFPPVLHDQQKQQQQQQRDVKVDAATTVSSCVEQVRNEFAACVTNMLAVWTEVGVGAKAGRQLLGLFPSRASAVPASSTAAQSSAVDDEYAVFLSELMAALTENVWTAALELRVRDWVAKTSFLQQTLTPEAPTDSPVAEKEKTLNAAANPDDVATDSQATFAFPLAGLAEADPCIRGWWRSMQASDLGMPTVHVYLLQVFTELQRIIAAREVRPVTGAGSCSEATAAASLRGDSEGEASLTAAADGVTEGNGEREEATTNLRKASCPSAAVFTAAELVVLLRLLASISIRGGLATASNFVGGPSSQRGVSAAAVGTLSASASRAGSILDALYHTAARHATTTNAEKRDGDGPAVATTTSGISNVEGSVEALERALLGSIQAHAAALPAGSLVEAAWLGLWSLPSLANAFAAARASTPAATSKDAASSSSPTRELPHNSPAAERRSLLQETPPMVTCLSSSNSAWLRDLHNDIHTSAHTRLLCCFLLYRHYNLLSAMGEKGGGVEAEEEERVSSPAVEEDDGAAHSAHALQRALIMIRGSCAEALVTQTVTARSLLTSGEEVSDHAGVEGGIPNTPGSSAAPHPGLTKGEKVEGVSKTDAEERQSAVSLLKDHAQLYLHVFVLSSALHHHLNLYEARHGLHLSRSLSAPVRESGDRSRDAEQRREVLQLHAALLAAAEAFAVVADRGHSLEVAQLLGMQTWRMRRVHLLDVDDTPTDGGTVESMQIKTRVEELNLCVKAGARDNSTALSVVAGNGAQSLFRYRALLSTLMPYVDAEILAFVKSEEPFALKLFLTLSAKAAARNVLYGLPDFPFAGCTSGKSPTDASHQHYHTSARLPLKPTTTTATIATKLGEQAEDVVVRTQSHLAVPSSSPFPLTLRTAAASTSSSSATSQALSTKAVPTFARKPIWSQLPLNSFFHRVVSTRTLVYRHLRDMCAAAIVAPEAASSLTPLFGVLRGGLEKKSLGNVQTLVLGITSSVAAFAAENQREMNLREDVTVLSPLKSPDVAEVVAVTAGERDTNGKACEGDETRDAVRRAPKVPIFRSVPVLPTVRGSLAMHRRLWASAVHRLCAQEGEAAAAQSDFDTTSLWVATLHCGGAVGAAETQLFEQLLACFLFNRVPIDSGEKKAGSAPSTQVESETTRIALLNASGWTLVLRACATAVDHHYRQTYRELLKDELVSYLRSATVTTEGGDSGKEEEEEEEKMAVLLSALDTAGPANCGLLEAIPELFVEDGEFWQGVVKCAVERWCDEAASATRRLAGGNTIAAARMNDKDWPTQWKRSFNWAVRTAGHASLIFAEVTEDSAQSAVVQKEMDALERVLAEVSDPVPAKRFSNRVAL